MINPIDVFKIQVKGMSTKEQLKVYTDTFDLIAQSRTQHQKYKKIASSTLDPILSWHRTDSVIFTLMEKLGQVNLIDNPNLKNIIQVYAAFNLIWNSADFLLDNTFLHRTNISPGELKTAPINRNSHTYTIKDVQKLLIEGIRNIKPEVPNFRLNIYKDIGRFRLNAIHSINRFPKADTPILDFQKAIQQKRDTTGLLAETAIKLYCQIADIEKPQQELITQLGLLAGLGMQFGDDIIDWRKDYFSYINQIRENRLAQPIDNLLLATISENKLEIHKILRQSFLYLPLPPALIIRMFAPETFKTFSQRFNTLINSFPQTDYTQYLQNIFRFAFYRLTMVLPNSFGLDEK